jgi:hypothetical protein
MLDKAVAAVKADKAKALDMFNKGEGGFLDRDLYVFCANVSLQQVQRCGAVGRLEHEVAEFAQPLRPPNYPASNSVSTTCAP